MRAVRWKPHRSQSSRLRAWPVKRANMCIFLIITLRFPPGHTPRSPALSCRSATNLMSACLPCSASAASSRAAACRDHQAHAHRWYHSLSCCRCNRRAHLSLEKGREGRERAAVLIAWEAPQSRHNLVGAARQRPPPPRLPPPRPLPLAPECSPAPMAPAPAVRGGAAPWCKSRPARPAASAALSARISRRSAACWA